MFQQQAESEGVHPNHNNNVPNSISEEPINGLPSNLGGSAHQSPMFYMQNSSSEEPIHQLPSNLGGSAHQSRLFNMLNSSQEESIHQLPRERPQQPQLSDAQIESNEFSGGGVQPNVNPGGSAHHPQLTEAQIAANYEIEIEPEEEEGAESVGVQPNVSPSSQSNSSSEEPINQLPSEPEILSAGNLNYYRPFHNAAKRGDWKSAKCFIEHDPTALAAKITADSQTVFHVAALCDQWEFILKLLELESSPEPITVQDKYGNTVLHYVAEGGSLKTAKALVEKNANLLHILGDNKRYPPLLNSIFSENKDLVWYLYLSTKANWSSDMTPWILHTLIKSGYHDIALLIILRNPDLALAKNVFGESLLNWLASNPSYFFSGSNLGLIERWIYKFVHVETEDFPTLSVILNIEDSTEGFQPRRLMNRVLQWIKILLWKAFVQLAPSVKKVRDAKLKHETAVKLVNHVCRSLQRSHMSFQEIEHFLTIPNFNILDSAIKCGIEEIVRTLLQEFPDLINVRVRPYRNILQAAIEYRQENIVNVIKEISTTTTKNLGSYEIELAGGTLHLAGKLAPAFKLFSVSGVALQMQRELQWFKEVEEITFTHRREWNNDNYEKPKDVFRTDHKKLAEEGEKWMKETANSCMLVSTLIATVLFAAAFTVPGGHGDGNGIAIFLHTNAFLIFAISDALGLFSSLTSLLMFLAILTARYELDDFLESLPKKLIIGLGSLFIAIAATIIAFGATLTIVLNKRWPWVYVPITLVAFFPVAIFVMLQLPLFVQMVQLTYGASIFRPWPSKKFE